MKCEECKFAKPFVDPFNQKQRLYCGKGLQIIDSFGDSMLVTGEYVTDCNSEVQTGDRKWRKIIWVLMQIMTSVYRVSLCHFTDAHTHTEMK